jgi:hypothetical protein
MCIQKSQHIGCRSVQGGTHFDAIMADMQCQTLALAPLQLAFHLQSFNA